MITTLITSIITFSATNIDDIFVLMLFYSQTNNTFRAWHVVAGQYLGFTALVLISLLGFLGGLLIAREWIGLLGFLPIIIGVRHWLHRNDLPEDDLDGQKVSNAGVLSAIFGVSGVTFANGGDNIGIYTPLFASSDLAALVTTLVVFYILLAVWCLAGYYLTRHKMVARVLSGYGHYIVPFVLVALGIFILIESGSYTLLSKR